MILVTGSSGYLGTYVCAALRARNVEYLNAPRAGVRRLADVLQDTVIHCAAVVPRTAADYEDTHAALVSIDLVKALAAEPRGYQMVFASSLSILAEPLSAYACGKLVGECNLTRTGDVNMRLPGLFGLPRRSGVIYEAAASGVILESFGPYPTMHVADAAEYMVRAATMPGDGNSEPFNVTYGDPRLEAVYGDLGVTFKQRVQEFADELRQPV